MCRYLAPDIILPIHHKIVRRCNIVSARYKRKKYVQTLALQSNLFQDFFSAMAESLRNLKDATDFRRFLCVRIEIDQL